MQKIKPGTLTPGTFKSNFKGTTESMQQWAMYFNL